MWFRIIIALLIFNLQAVQAQKKELIPDPGFELHHGGNSLHWKQPVGNYNHFQICGHVARCLPYQGRGYHQLCMFKSEPNEFMHVQLNEKMAPGKNYRISFAFRLAGLSDMLYRDKGIENLKTIDFLFTDYPIDVMYKRIITAQPQLRFTIDHSRNRAWSFYSMDYVAKGDEKFLTIGSFMDMAEKIFLQDSIKVLKDSLLSIEQSRSRQLGAAKEGLEFLKVDGEETAEGELILEKDAAVYTGKIPREKKKKLTKEQQEALERNRKNQAILKARVQAIDKEHDALRKDIESRYSKMMYSFDVNFCFDNVSIIELPGDPVMVSSDPLKKELKKGDIIKLDKVYFETAQSILLPASIDQLNQLHEILVQNPSLVIKICGHTDNQGKKEYNQTLSEDRAKAVFEYLLIKGISKDRLSWIGFGPDLPVTDNETEESRALNRRVEFLILEK